MATTLTLSQATLDLINKAEADLGTAEDADAAHTVTVTALSQATTGEQAAAQAASAAHQTATASALAAIAALRAELQLPPS